MWTVLGLDCLGGIARKKTKGNILIALTLSSHPDKKRIDATRTFNAGIGTSAELEQTMTATCVERAYLILSIDGRERIVPYLLGDGIYPD